MKEFKRVASNVLVFVIILWAIRLIDSILVTDLCRFGIYPRTVSGLTGILFAPFLHASWFHLISNTIPVFVLLTILFVFYKKEGFMVVAGSVLIGGGLVWVFGRQAIHVGISGLIYSLAAFIITAGILKKELKALLISIVIIILYGGLIWGIFPGRYWVSWEGHLFGALAGVLIAFSMFKKK